MDIETWELMSYVVTVVGLPLAIAVFVFQQTKERRNEENEVFELLSDNYQQFLRVVLDHPELRLFSMSRTPAMNEEQHERMTIIFTMLIGLFERSYMLLYERDLRGAALRRWGTWEDSMREWCEREDFRDMLPVLLVGEDPEFGRYITGLAAECAAAHRAGLTPPGEAAESTARR